MRVLALFAAATVAAAAAAAPAGGAGGSPCAAVDRGVLPSWARTGFTDPRPRAPHVLGQRGSIVAILFGDPLTFPPPATRNNKILWVAKWTPHSRAALWIRALRYEGARPVGAPVTRVVPGGPGPSIVNLPAAGCWRLRLHWAGGSDELALRYHAP